MFGIRPAVSMAEEGFDAVLDTGCPSGELPR